MSELTYEEIIKNYKRVPFNYPGYDFTKAPNYRMVTKIMNDVDLKIASVNNVFESFGCKIHPDVELTSSDVIDFHKKSCERSGEWKHSSEEVIIDLIELEDGETFGLKNKHDIAFFDKSMNNGGFNWPRNLIENENPIRQTMARAYGFMIATDGKIPKNVVNAFKISGKCINKKKKIMRMELRNDIFTHV